MKAGIKLDGQFWHTLKAHVCRRTAKAGVDIRKVSRALGHSSVVVKTSTMLDGIEHSRHPSTGPDHRLFQMAWIFP